MNLAVYLRGPTQPGSGPNGQESACRGWAGGHGHRVAAVCRDDAAALVDREGLADALDAVRSHAVSGIVVARLDRLDDDLVVQEQLLAEIRRLGGEAFSAAAGEADLRALAGDPHRQLVREVLERAGEYGRAMTTLRLRRGRRRKAEQGGYAGDGSPPYGLRAQDRQLVVDDREAAALERIGRLHAEGMSLRAMIEVLDDEGHAPKRGGRWHPQTLARVVARLDQQPAGGRPRGDAAQAGAAAEDAYWAGRHSRDTDVARAAGEQVDEETRDHWLRGWDEADSHSYDNVTALLAGDDPEPPTEP